MSPLPVDLRAPWLRACASGALLTTLVVVARELPSPSRASAPSIERCELEPPHDVEGLEACLALLPRDIELMLDLGALHEQAGALRLAEVLYRRALTIDPKDGDLHVRLGRVLLQLGRGGAAASEARAALRIQPQSARARHLLHQSLEVGE